MPPKPPNYKLWFKMFVGGAAMAVGGPALVMYLAPTEEELFQRYNPDLQKRALETRYERQKEYDDFVVNLKKHAMSDKNIWIAGAEMEKDKAAKQNAAEQAKTKQDAREQLEQMRKEVGLGPAKS